MDKTAQKILNTYAHDLEGLTLTECMDAGFSVHQCGVLSGALGYGPDAVITADEYKKLEAAGFSREFIDGISDSDGKKALKERVKWLADRGTEDAWHWWDDAEFKKKDQIFEELGATGPDAEEAVSVLVEGVKMGIFNPSCTSALVRISDLAIPYLVECLKDDKVKRGSCAHAIGEYGSKSYTAVPALIDGLEDGNIYVRGKYVQALGRIGSLASAAIPALQNCLFKKSPVSADCAVSLAKIGLEALPALMEDIENNDPYIRRVAAMAFGEMDPSAAIFALPDLDRIRKEDPISSVRDMAEKAFEKIAGY